MRKFASIALIATLAATGLTACSDDEDTATDETTAAETTEAPETTEAAADSELGTIPEVAAEAGIFTTLLAAAESAGLVETLSTQELTVFAPTDEAFVAALGALGITAEELLADTEKLTSILTYHVVPGKVTASEAVKLDGQSVATVNGAEVAISVDGDKVMVNDATVTSADVMASNGVIHVIDTVLLPPDFDPTTLATS